MRRLCSSKFARLGKHRQVPWRRLFRRRICSVLCRRVQTLASAGSVVVLGVVGGTLVGNLSALWTSDSRWTKTSLNVWEGLSTLANRGKRHVHQRVPQRSATAPARRRPVDGHSPCCCAIHAQDGEGCLFVTMAQHKSTDAIPKVARLAVCLLAGVTLDGRRPARHVGPRPRRPPASGHAVCPR